MALDLMSASESTTDQSCRFESSRSSESTSSPQKIVPTISQPGVDKSAIETAVRTILSAVGEDVNRDGLLDTPARVARMYEEMFAGLRLDPARHLETTFPEDYDEIVLVRDIPFTSMCEHHLVPFHGRAHIAYLPRGKVVGLSKLVRVTELFARRMQVVRHTSLPLPLPLPLSIYVPPLVRPSFPKP